MQPNEKPHLVITAAEDEHIGYRCSVCGQLFLLPDDQSPKEAAIELLASFQEHVVVEHALEAKN